MFTKTVVALSLAASALAQFSVNSPTFVQCQPVLISWTGSTSSPFTLAIIPGGQPTAPAIEFVSDSLTTSPYTWTVNLAAGTNISLRLTDSTGANTYSAGMVIQQGASSSCLNASASTSGLTAGAVTTTNTASTTGGASASAGSMSMTSMASSASAGASSAAMSSAAMSSAAASRASSAAAGGASSAAGAVTSAAASATSAATGAGYTSAFVGLPAVFAGLLGFAVLA